MAATLTADEEGLIRKRLLSQTAVARINADAPLKKLTKRHEALVLHNASSLSLRAAGFWLSVPQRPRMGTWERQPACTPFS